MADEKTQAGQVSVSQKDGAVERIEICSMGKKGWLKRGLAMGICCAAPLLLVGAIALLGISLGALASGFLSVAALLACPVGMYLMMRMMTKQNAGKAQHGDK